MSRNAIVKQAGGDGYVKKYAPTYNQTFKNK
jgi:hypothetical protein